MRKFLLALLLVLVCCANAFALSDNEYAQLMKNAEFKRADQALSRAWKEAQRKLAKNKTALNNLRKDQREWVARGRDSEAEDFMDIEGYSKLKAYTVATEERAAYLPELANQYLEGSNNSNNNKKPQAQTKTDERLKQQAQNQAKAQAKLEYPTFGICTGSNVRLRNMPGTGSDSKVVGRADKNDRFVIVSGKDIKGDVWYELAGQESDERVWISGQFMNVYNGSDVTSPLFKLTMALHTLFGFKPERAKAVLGEPKNITSDTFFFDPAGRELREDTYEYSECTLRYVEGVLMHIELSALDSFRNLFGENREDVINNFGKPLEDENSDSLNYELKSLNQALLFEFEDDRIVRVTWDEYMDG